MNKNKISLVLMMTILSVFLSFKAFALETDVKVSAEATNIKTEVSAKMNAEVNSGSDSESESKGKDEQENNASSSEDKNENDSNKMTDNEKENDATSSKSNIGDEHRSAVATFVQSLLSVANREGGIGDQVRKIAQEQNDSSSTTLEAIVKVENRGGFSRFLFGADYKNLGTIRSELAKTSDRINKLTDLASSTSINASDKETLQAQIDALKSDQVKLNTFVDVNENKFSLLGWFVKLFNK